MDVKACYDSIGGSYEAIHRRIPNDPVVEKFMKKFLEDPCYGELRQAMEEENWGNAFKASHALKGVSANLNFSRLSESADRLTELLREFDMGKFDKNKCLDTFREVSDDYSGVIESIRKYI
jgi:chemotaxis protein histidine kinase CheA